MIDTPRRCTAAACARRRALIGALVGALPGAWISRAGGSARGDGLAAGAPAGQSAPGTARGASAAGPTSAAGAAPNGPGPAQPSGHPPAYPSAYPSAQSSAHPSAHPPAYAPTYPAHPGYAAATMPLPLAVDDLPQRLDHYLPAGGPLERHTARPGAWYTAVYVPRLPPPHLWPLQLWLWQRDAAHGLRISALDGWPPSRASVVVPLATSTEVTARGRPLSTTVPFVLPAASHAEGVFLLIEQWSRHGERPPALWLQARAAEPAVLPLRERETAWWQGAEPPPAAPAAPAAPAEPPPGPLRSPRALAVVELPILRLTSPAPRPAPVFEPWWER